MTDFSVIIDNVKITDGEIFELTKTQNKPLIKFGKNGFYYTVAMVDPDAPSAKNPIYKYWLHLLTINNNQDVVSFEPPTPPSGSGPHRYYIFLLKQKSKLDENKINISSRKNFNLGSFIAENDLEIIDNIHFVTEKQ